MKSKLLGCLAAAAVGAAVIDVTPAMAFRGGFGGMHGGGFHGGGMHFGGGGFGGIRGGMFAGRGVFAPGGRGFVGEPFVHQHVFANRFHNFPFRHHHNFRRFAFVGAPFAYGYAAYDGCWRQTWTSYGWQWVNVCYDYGY